MKLCFNRVCDCVCVDVVGSCGLLSLPYWSGARCSSMFCLPQRAWWLGTNWYSTVSFTLWSELCSVVVLHMMYYVIRVIWMLWQNVMILALRWLIVLPLCDFSLLIACSLYHHHAPVISQPGVTLYRRLTEQNLKVELMCSFYIMLKVKS